MILLGVFALIFSLNNKKNESLGAGNEEFNVEGIINGDKGYISSAQVIQTKTGTGPWDADDEPGNDSSEDNNIVRSFDQVIWTVESTMQMKSNSGVNSLTGGILNIEAKLPETCTYMKWDIESMTWTEGTGKLSDAGRTLSAQYKMSESNITVPGKQTLTLVLKLEGAKNALEIKPEIKVWLEGNEENEKCTVTNVENVYVSSAPKYDIRLDNYDTGIETETKDGNARVYKYSLAFLLQGDSVSKGLKGVEYPQGDLTFDINYNLQRTVLGETKYEDITNGNMKLFNYKYNISNTDMLGDSQNSIASFPNTSWYSFSRLPVSSGGGTRTRVYQNGNLKMVDNGSGVINVTISNYGMNGTFPDRAIGRSYASDSNYTFAANIGFVSLGMFYMQVNMNEETTKNNTQGYINIEETNMKVNTISGDICTAEVNKGNNTIRANHITYPAGSFSKEVEYENMSGQTLATPWGAGNSKTALNSQIIIRSRISNSSANAKKDWIWGTDELIKFDDEAMEPILFENGVEYKTSGVWGSCNLRFNILYAGKQDKTGWNSDSEMIKTTAAELVYFDTLEELKQNGYVCVAVMAESQSGYVISGIENVVSIPLQIINTAKPGQVYQTVNDVWIYNEENAPDRSTQTYLKTANRSDFPSTVWAQGNLPYVKTSYDENGQMEQGSHGGGYKWGNSLLVVGAEQKVELTSWNEDATERKTNYDIGRNENIINYRIAPQLNGNADIVGVTVKLTTTLPKGLEYVAGSSDYIEPDIINNSNGTTTLIWEIYNCSVGESIRTINFKTHINEETPNGTQYTTQTIILADKDKVGNADAIYRTVTNTITVTNLASHRLYKETDEPIVEKNQMIKYHISYKNNTDENVPEFQLLDILPYNGDVRGTKYNGTYILDHLEITGQTGLKTYISTDESVRNITAKDENIGISNNWKEININNIKENATAFAVKGEISAGQGVDIMVYLTPTGNQPKDIYVNSATVQTNKDSEEMTSTDITVQVVSRKIQGKVWDDSNRNGVIDSSEKYIEGRVVKLLYSTNNTEVTRTTTNAQGEYEFRDLAKGTYKVELEVDSLHELTDKEVGTNKEINSKFNQSTKQTDEITKLNTISSPEIIEENVNAGIRTIQYNINTKVEGAGGNISGEGQDIYESVDKGENSVKDIIISPNIGYRVNTITVNGEPIEFTEEENHIVILNKFINMQENKEVIVTFKKIETSVLVHHYKENTTEQLSKDVTINGEVGDDYTTQVATDIPKNYELVETPVYASGKMTEDQIVVTYYYRLKTPDIANQNINKTGTDRMTVANQEMSYTVTYTAAITDYIGNAEVTIVDTLPYAIDEGKSDLAGGTYDSASKTITWKENVSDINSYSGAGTVSVTKTFKVVYIDLDMNQEKITNNVKGHIKLLTPEKTSEEVTGDQDATIYKAIISSEKLVDKTEATEGEKVTYTIRITNDGNLAKTVTVRDTLPAGITFDKDTLIKVGNLDTVYTEQNLKNGIPVEVPAKGSIDVVFVGKIDTLANNEYSKTLTNQATVDNEPTNEVKTEVTKANITAHKESDPSSGNKVREGDEITYRIRVRNDGTRAGDVIVKDAIPTGTTFVEGSIKIDNVADSSKTATDLQNGIALNVPISTEKVVEFKVRVNKLIDGTKIKNTAYINQNGEDKKVPEEPEHTYVEPKEEQSISKNGTATIESLDQEITYNISYTARITDYSGRAAVKLVDKLPYAIDEAKSDLAGGTYDAQAQTITWEETVENIQITEEKEVTINKIIKVVYTGINQGTTAIKNIVTGQIEYETPVMTSDEVTANSTTTTGFTVNVQVSKVWEDDSNKLGQRPTKVVFKLHGSDGSEYTLELAKPGTQGSTTTQDSTNPNKWNDIFTNLPKYDSNNQEIVYTITEEEKTEGDLKYYESSITDKTVTNTNKYGKVTVHHYIMNTDGSTTTTRVPDAQGQDVQDTVIEGKEGNPYTTEETKNINEKYELVAEKLPANATGTIEKYNEEKSQEVIYYYRLKPAKVLINYLEKDSNEVLSTQERITGYVDNSYNTNIDHRKETIQKDGKTYTLVKDSGNTDGIMTVADTTVTYYYLQNTKATVRYVERDPETGDIVKDLEEPTVKEGIVGDKFVTNEKAFIGYKLVEEPEHKTINMTKEEQTLIYYYEPVYTGLIENHIDDKTGKILETKTYEIQVGQDYNIPSKEFEGYDLVEEKLPANAEGTMGEEVVTVNYYYIKKAVLEVNYIDIYTNKPLIGQIVDNTKHEGDLYTTEQKTFENYDLVEVPSNATGTMKVETAEEGNITNNRTVVTYYYTQRAIVEEHHIDSLTGKDIEEPTIHNGHVGDKYDIPSKEFLSYKLIEEDEEGNSMLPTNSQGIMTAEKIVVNYYYNQPAKVIVHYVEKTTGKELEETNPETGELQQALVVIEGFNQDEYETTAKEFEYYTLIESPTEPNGTMKVEITKDEEENDIVNNTIELYYYYEAKPFNIGVEKEITGIIVNGERRTPTNGKLEKVEIYRKAAEDTSVQIEYKIKVSNTGEVSGNATIEENIPEGMSLANNDGTWKEQEGKLIKVIPVLGAGEIKEYTVLLNWEQSGNNMGEKANEVKLVETGNVPGFVDNNDKDNTSNANVIISVETGELPIGLILALVGLTGLETITLRYAVVLTKRQKRSKKQNVTKK